VSFVTAAVSRHPFGKLGRMEREQVLAFRAARQGLASRTARTLAEAAACPASDFQPGSALLALAARASDVERERYEAAIDSGELAAAHSLRGALHVTTPEHSLLFGRALIADRADDLVEQLGEQAKQVLAEHALDARQALDEVARATADALGARSELDKNELHEELRARVRQELMPWCNGCKSHHVMPMLWRYALVRLGARRNSSRRYVLGEQRETPPAVEAVRRFLRIYGPTTREDLHAWAGLGRAQARALWREIEDELEEVDVDGGRTFVLASDRSELESPPAARGLRLLPPGDPFLQQPNRRALLPDPDVRKRAFRAVGSPGVVLQDGLPAGFWRARARGQRLDLTVEPLAAIDRDALAAEADRVARLRGADGAAVSAPP
jgi:hypothetical protein